MVPHNEPTMDSHYGPTLWAHTIDPHNEPHTMYPHYGPTQWTHTMDPHSIDPHHVSMLVLDTLNASVFTNLDTYLVRCYTHLHIAHTTFIK